MQQGREVNITYIDSMIKFLRIDGLQDRHDDSQQLFRIFEGLHIEVHRAAFRIDRVQLTPADIAGRQGQNRVRLVRSLCDDSLPLGLIKAISWLCRCWSLAVRLIKDLDARTMHALQVLLYPPIDLIFGVPGCSLANVYIASRVHVPLHYVHE